MRPQIVFGTLLAGTAAASSNIPGVLRGAEIIQKRQTGPVSPDTASDCTYWDTALEGFNTCVDFQSAWEITFDNFFDYNPSIKDDCSGILIGNSYCVEVNFGIPRPTSPKTSSTRTSTAMTKTTSGPTGTLKPSPTQAGLISSCTTFYFAIADDNCNRIVAMYNTFSLDNFVQWNPAVGTTCSGIWADTWYCVGIPGTPTAKPSITAVPTTLQTQTSVQSPGSTGLPCILKFVNSAYYCVEDPHDCNPSAPSQAQPSTICGCKKWHKVAENDTCSNIVTKYKISRTQLDLWNPTINNGGDCKTMWRDYSVCVGV